MHREIGAAVEQGGFEFLDEQALAAHLGQGAVQDLVAARGQRQQLDAARRVARAQQIAHMLGLPQGKPAGARGDGQAFYSGHVRASEKAGDDDRSHHPQDGQHEQALQQAQARFVLLGVGSLTQTH